MTSRWAAIPLPFRLGAIAALVLGAWGCGEESKPEAMAPPDAEGSDEPLSTYEPCAVEEDVGEFIIDLADDFTSVQGKVQDGIVPATLTEELASEGSCRLVTPLAFDCDPPCPTSTQWCNSELTCTPLPQGRDVGTVTIEGLSAPVAMTPTASTKNYSKAPPVPHPGFEPGANIRLTTTGGEYDPFELRGWGVSRFVVTGQPRVDPGTSTSLSWEVPADPGPAHVTVSLNINLHGSNTAWIECDFPDTGAAEVPASLIDGLIAQGLSGFPTIAVTRQSASSARIEPGCVELLVKSVVETSISVAGITSCNNTTPCPSGLTCNVELFCE